MTLKNTPCSNRIRKPTFTSKSKSKHHNVKQSSIITPTTTTSSAAVEKISQIELSEEQWHLKLKILKFTREGLLNYQSAPSVFLINGDAGTGKSVILNSIFNEIQKLSRDVQAAITSTNDHDIDILANTRNFLVVNHPEMLKLYHQISKQFPYILKSDIERPTSLINKYYKKSKSKSIQDKIDVLIIDEAHLLATSRDPFKKFHQDNHLEELLKISKVVIMVFDEKQSLRMGSFWSSSPTSQNGASLTTLLKSTTLQKFQIYNLTNQFRITGANQDLLNWITQLSTSKKIAPLPVSSQITTTTKSFDFKIFENCQTMYEHIKYQNTIHGQSRIISTYDFPYRLDGHDHFVTSQSDSFKLRWDRYLPQLSTPWSERPDTIEEVGSVYTIQGFDLNYAGVILGRSIGYDSVNDSILIKPEYYDDNAGFTRKKNIKDVDMVKQRIVLNSVNVLLTRGVLGLYIYAWDKELRERLMMGNPSILVRDTYYHG